MRPYDPTPAEAEEKFLHDMLCKAFPEIAGERQEDARIIYVAELMELIRAARRHAAETISADFALPGDGTIDVVCTGASYNEGYDQTLMPNCDYGTALDPLDADHAFMPPHGLP